MAYIPTKTYPSSSHPSMWQQYEDDSSYVHRKKQSRRCNDSECEESCRPKPPSGGPIGPQGPCGPPGCQGPIGPQGPEGQPGPYGPQGCPGPAGPMGPQGPIGQNGIQGATGPTGPQGPPHRCFCQCMVYTGPTGPTGPAGGMGATGPVGPQGSAGTQGALGPQGLQGSQGPRGYDGLVGPMGPVGPQGSQGLQGYSGQKGDRGDMGPTGPSGPQGSQGLQGSMGPTGPGGSQGLQGSMGPTGPSGSMGPQGSQGYQGSMGPTGPSGGSGATGPTGASARVAASESNHFSTNSVNEGTPGQTNFIPYGLILTTDPSRKTGVTGISTTSVVSSDGTTPITVYVDTSRLAMNPKPTTIEARIFYIINERPYFIYNRAQLTSSTGYFTWTSTIHANINLLGTLSIDYEPGSDPGDKPPNGTNPLV